MFNRTYLAAGLAAASMAVISDSTIAASPRPGEGQRRKPSPTYRQKIPATATDHYRVRLAALKRARKADRLHANAAAGGIAQA